MPPGLKYISKIGMSYANVSPSPEVTGHRHLSYRVDAHQSVIQSSELCPMSAVSSTDSPAFEIGLLPHLVLGSEMLKSNKV